MGATFGPMVSRKNAQGHGRMTENKSIINIETQKRHSARRTLPMMTTLGGRVLGRVPTVHRVFQRSLHAPQQREELHGGKGQGFGFMVDNIAVSSYPRYAGDLENFEFLSFNLLLNQIMKHEADAKFVSDGGDHRIGRSALQGDVELEAAGAQQTEELVGCSPALSYDERRIL